MARFAVPEPATLVLTASLDPLLDQGRAYAAKTIAAGVPVVPGRGAPGMSDDEFMRRVNELINGRRVITPDTAIRLAMYFGNEAAFWMHLQVAWDMHAAVRHSYAALKPGGVLLATFAGISQISRMSPASRPRPDTSPMRALNV